MNEKRLFLDIHAVQTLPPSNVNRDDAGSPKTAQYGGVTRSRISSQACKRAMRYHFIDSGIKNVGVRTLEIGEMIKDNVLKLDNTLTEDEAVKTSVDILKETGFDVDNKSGVSKALMFLSSKQAENLARTWLSRDPKDKKIGEKLLLAANSNPSVDLALFGRMVASKPALSLEAACQVAHALSTHAVDDDFDFYVALDDLKKDKQGAGMLGVIEFNSSTVYRYANVNLHQLYSQISGGNEFVLAVKLFIDAFIKSMPTGKINSFANQTIPQAVIISLREDRPLNLVSAFEEPVKSNNGYVKPSIERLFGEHEKYSLILDKPLSTRYVLLDKNDGLAKIGEREESINSLESSVTKEIEVYFGI